MRRAAKKDLVHRPIVDALELQGFVVSDVSALPGLGYDAIVCEPSTGKIVLVEFKSDKKVHHKSAATRLRPSQVKAIALLPIKVADTWEQVVGYFR